MKKLFCVCVVVIGSLIFNSKSESRVVNIYVTNNHIFFPNSIAVEVGDVIKWTASSIEIQHTTVCDGRPGTARPRGAASWSSPVLNSGGFSYLVEVPGYYRYICGIMGHFGSFNATITSASSNSEIIDDFNLYQNYPNPFNPETKISFSIPKDEFVKLEVYDALGREINILVNEFRSQGTYEVSFDGSNFSGGMYFYRITAGDFTETKKMSIIK